MYDEKDKQEQINNFVDMLDSYMANGGGHLKASDESRNILTSGEKNAESFSKLCSISNECPTCADIPNISDVDDN